MTELISVSQATRKENSLLERQLHIKLQIIKEEYRMTTRSLEKHVRDLRNWLVCIQHTTQGVESFKFLNTKLIESRNPLKRPAEYNTFYRQEVSPHSQLNRRQHNVQSDRGESETRDLPRKELTNNCVPCRIETSEEGQDSDVTSLLIRVSSKFPKYGAAANSVQDETTRMKVLSRFETIFDLHAHKQRGISYDKLKTPDRGLSNRDLPVAAKVHENVSERRPSGGRSYTSAVGSTGFVRSRRLIWSAPSRSKRNGFEVKTRTDLTESKTRTDLTEANPRIYLTEAKTRTHLTEVKTRTDLTEAKTRTDLAEAKTRTDLTDAKTRTDLTEAKTRTDLIEAKTGTDLTEAQTRTDLTEANPRIHLTEAKTRTDLTKVKTTADLTKAEPRTDLIEAKSGTDKTNRQLADDFGLPSAAETWRVPQKIHTTVTSATLWSHTSAQQQLQNKLKRSSTAPDKCPLPGEVVSLSRQQIAGFLAEVHSRKADIQALLKKSRQLKDTVKKLDPEGEQIAEDSD